MTEEINDATNEAVGDAVGAELQAVAEELPPPLPDEVAADTIVPDDATRGVGPEEVARLVAEAEQRGYLKARNEMARAEMEKPVVLSNPTLIQPASSAGGLAARFLSELPRRVWD